MKKAVCLQIDAESYEWGLSVRSVGECGNGIHSGKWQHAWEVSRLKAGVCRPCDTIAPTATNCNFSLCRRVEKVCVDRQILRYS